MDAVKWLALLLVAVALLLWGWLAFWQWIEEKRLPGETVRETIGRRFEVWCAADLFDEDMPYFDDAEEWHHQRRRAAERKGK